MPTRSPAKPVEKKDVNQSVSEAINAATESEPVKGEDLIEDPKLRAAFIEAKKALKPAQEHANESAHSH